MKKLPGLARSDSMKTLPCENNENGKNSGEKMTYEFDGKKYEKASSHQKEWGERIIEELALKGTERILDLGCGDGVLTAELARLVPEGEVLGIDASRGMIETAVSRQGENLRFALMDINTLEIDRQFDVVFSNATLHWVKDHRRLLSNVLRVLFPGGLARFNFAGDGNCSYFFKVIRESMTLPGFSKYFVGFPWPWFMPTVEDYKTLVKDSGFSSTEVWGENTDRFFPDRDALIKWVDQPSLVPFMAYVAEGDKKSFREFVVRRMIEETTQVDCTCFETFRRINLLARK
ncbi:MAG: methyltransferase domain-containing protein [Thermodesulfobacteriota bacterium]